MFLIILAFLMKFADISKMQSKRCINNNNNNNNNQNNNNNNNNTNTNTSIMSQKRWQLHNANNKTNSNSSSTSSGCDSSGSSSSKENNYQQQQPQQQQQQQHHSLTPQQLQQLRHYQQLQQQQLQLLQQQLLQRKRLQQQLREQGVEIKRPPTASTATLTCNQQYLKQLRLQQQQQQQQHHLYNMRLPQHHQPAQHIDNIVFHNKNLNRNLNDILNNNNNNNNLNPELQQLSNGGGRMIFKGQKSCRGMTEFSTNNDINNKTHLSSQPLQNSPRHHFTPYPTSNPSSSTTNNTTHHLASLTNNYPIHNTTYTQSSNAQFTKQQFTQTLKQQLINNNKNNQQTLPYNNSSANARTPSSNGSSVTHSPTHHHYRKPFNSPNNSPFAYCGGGGNQQLQQQQQQQQQLLQQQRRNSSKLPFLTHTQYQQHLNDLLLQQQQLQQQQQQLLQSKDASDESELSEESLKQNVAIVLNNLDRYNNALRSIILNEQVNTNNSVFYDDSDLNFLTGGNCGGGGNNNSVNLQHHHYQQQQQQQQHQLATMATAITPESDYNSNATTPGSRSNMLPYESSGNMLPHNQQQPHQHLVGFSNTTTGGGVNNGGGVLNNACGVGYMGNNLNCSLASSHDFTHDNSDYQWFLDYGYRDGCGGMQRSVLSSLSASYNGLGDLIYEDLAKNLDANLAEVDMESFRAEDIHSLLSQLPSYCKSLGGNRLQQSLMLQQHMLPSNNCQHQMAHNMSQTSTTSTNDLIDNSFCKSELLFSPVKESHISVDSLDMDAYPEDGDIILTCKANKDNYTIAFEGSVLYSDESFYEPNEIAMKNKQNFINLHSNLDDIVKRKSLEVSMSRSEQPQQCSLRNKLQKSHTTQLQSLYALLSSSARRYPSGNNNNTPETITIIRPPIHLTTGCVRKCSSLPNLRDDTQEQMNSSQTQIHTLQQTPQKQQQQQQQHQQQLNVSTAITTSHIEHNLQPTKSRNLLPMCQIPISCNSTAASIEERLNVLSLQQQHQQQQQQCHTRQPKHRCCCGSGVSGGVGAIGSNLSNHSNASMGSNNGSATIISHHSNKGHHITGSTSSGSSNPPAFNLVKLFIKQKSTNCSLEDQPSAHTCMDISSGCWPSSDANNSSSSSSLEQRLRKKSMNDSGKGSALSRHDEEADNATSTFHMDASASTPKKQHQGRSSVFYEEDPSSSSTGSLTATNSPAHRRRSMPLRNPALNQLALQLNGNNNSSASLLSSDNTSEQLTQVQLSGGQESTSTSAKAAERNKQRRSRDASRPISNASSSEMITRSMQTSCGSLSTRSSLSDRFRFVPPSFLEKLNNLGEENQAPIYVIYPNYALPDLGFVKTSATPDVIFSPFNYKMNMDGNTSTASSCASIKKRFSLMTGSDEDEILKTMDYKHVVDWQSLATLLPGDYRRRLKHIPEVNGILSHLERELAQKPLFCLTPPVRRNRTHICDCNQYFQRGEQHTEAAGGSSSSGSSHQPSSGYRGSSTLLTDSEFENANNNAHGCGDNLKQMYVYQYEQQRMDSGVEMSPKVQSTPIPMPRGILRKSSSAVRSKRNSMIEQDAKLTKLEKRRSLQEAPYNYHIGSAEELAEVFEEELSGAEIYATPQPRTERLSRKDLDARARAENFLSSLPRNELKYYAEIASILESSEQQVQYDAAALKKEVSRALSQQKKVSFNDKEEADSTQHNLVHLPAETRQRFSTPPNSPNISMATNTTAATTTNNATLRQPATATIAGVVAPPVATRRCSKRDELEKQKLESNRFKRLQIQWELMSKDSSMLKELAQAEQTKSGGSTPTSAVAAANAAAAAAAQKSRIPRPVSYPAGKRTDNCKIPRTTTMTETPHKNNNIANNTKIPKPSCAISPQLARITNQADPSKATRSPSRIQPPKRYSMTAAAAVTPSPITTPTSSAGTTTTRARTPNSRVAVTAPNTPKKRVQSPRTIPRVR